MKGLDECLKFKGVKTYKIVEFKFGIGKRHVHINIEYDTGVKRFWIQRSTYLRRWKERGYWFPPA